MRDLAADLIELLEWAMGVRRYSGGLWGTVMGGVTGWPYGGLRATGYSARVYAPYSPSAGYAVFSEYGGQFGPSVGYVGYVRYAPGYGYTGFAGRVAYGGYAGSTEAAGATPAPETGAPQELADAYRTLGLEPGAPHHEVKAAYRTLAQRHHPDTGGDTETMIRINTAYDIIRRQQRQPRQPRWPSAERRRERPR